MSKRVRAITLSCVTVLCCIAIIIAATLALFSESVSVNNHLQAGNLKVTLTRTSYSNTLLNSQGLLETYDDATVVDFTQNNKNNIFGLDGGVVLVPKSSLQATLTLTNTGSVAVGYYLELVFNGDKEGKVNALAEQLLLTLKVDGLENQTVMLDQLKDSEGGYTWGSANNPLGQVLVNETNTSGSGTFTVQLDFIDSEQNDAAQGQTVSVDIIVHAIQIVTQLG